MPHERENRPVSLITGASRGIGRAIAIALARDAGFDVVVNYATNQAAAEEVRRDIESLGNGSRAVIVQADVANADQRKHLVDQTISSFGRIDLLVNNAG